MMSALRKIGFITCVLLIALCSCNSSKSASKKRRKQAPCDCPKFNYVPQPDNAYKTYAFNVMNVAGVINANA
jgi:hypothetical protein